MTLRVKKVAVFNTSIPNGFFVYGGRGCFRK